MQIEEGQIYEGGVSISGGPGPFRRWIVVAPFARHHAHSIDDPLELHCLTVDALTRGLKNGLLTLKERDLSHPILTLQREKERRQIKDIHLGLTSATLEAMLQLLDDAVAMGEPHAPFAAGEIMTLTNESLLTPKELGDAEERLNRLLAAWENRA